MDKARFIVDQKFLELTRIDLTYSTFHLPRSAIKKWFQGNFALAT
jgi:hypothetical protein